MGISLVIAKMIDCERIRKMQVKSFNAILEKYEDYETNPATEPVERIEYKMAHPSTIYYFICHNNENIGVIRLHKLSKDTYRISPMFILPKYQGYGYAQQAIMELESLHPEAKNWELDTIKQEAKLCYLYEKMGYKTTGKEDIQDGMTIIHYAK
jgi:RimJ/RimL family protein N-acetyltransferase